MTDQAGGGSGDGTKADGSKDGAQKDEEKKKKGGNPAEGGADDVDANGKYLLLSVPEFGVDPVTGKKMTSFLRLGAASTTWELDPGGKLEKNVYLGGPPGGHLAEAMEKVPVRSEAQPFVDDARFRGKGATPREGAAGHGIDEGGRENISKYLHERGGWRDHSDGNRITTTNGDKIEIIRGNYKMIVLGRQAETDDGSEFGNASGWDVSGQHIQDFAATMPGASVRVEWVPELYASGVWHLQNTTENVQQSSRFAGTFREEWWGDLKESFTGIDKTAAEAANYVEDVEGTMLPRGNPFLKEITYAREIYSRTGSSSTRVPKIREELYAKDTVSITDVLSSYEETTCDGEMKSKTTAGSVDESTTVEGTMSSSTKADRITETTTVNSQRSTTNVSGNSTDITIAGTINEVAITGGKASVEITGGSAEVCICPIHAKLDIGMGLDVNIAGLIGITIAAKFEFEMALAMAINTGYVLEITLGKKLSLIGDETEVKLNSLELAIIKKLTGLSLQLG